MAATKLTREQKDEIEALALKLYAKYNPRPLVKINVGKRHCLNEAQQKLFPKPQR